jgi:glycosyltransferase involved in cell wall biosynthesis
VTTELWFPDYMGGTARVARETAIALARRGHEVTVVAPRSASHLPVEMADKIEIHRAVVRIRGFPRTFTDPFVFARELRQFDVRQFDVAVAHHVPNARGASAALPDLPLAYVFHASPFRESQFRRSAGIGRRSRARARLTEPALAILERQATHRARSVLVLSEFSKGLLAADHPEAAAKVKLVGGGVDTSRFAPSEVRDVLRAEVGLDVKDVVMLTVRRLVPRMGVDRLLHAAARLRERIPRLRLVVLGDGELRSSLERLASDIGVSDRTTFLGRVSEAELIHWYQRSDLFVLPSVAYEGFGMVTAEALACGVPVVGTTIGATPELLTPLGPSFLADTADDLVATIDQIIPCLGHDLRQRCRMYAESELDWDRVIVRWEAALEETARRR